MSFKVGSQSRISAERSKVIQKMFAAGKTVSEISRRMNMARSTISSILNRGQDEHDKN